MPKFSRNSIIGKIPLRRVKNCEVGHGRKERMPVTGFGYFRDSIGGLFFGSCLS
jgi:hypothetical protein